MMFKNQFQKMLYAFLTVIITVHGYVFYSLYVVNGTTLMNVYQTTSVLKAIEIQGGVYMFGKFMPIWSIILVEFLLAYILEITIGSPLSYRLAIKVFDPQTTHGQLFETAIICSTVGIMCPLMSLLAAFIYYPFYKGFDVIVLLANWLKLVCLNLPFAYFSQLFFIQPFVRFLFSNLLRKISNK